MNEAGVVYWLLTDHLGSTALTLNSSGSRVAELRYRAFGETRYNGTPSGTPTDYRFTGQRQDSGLGLYHMGARWYDPALGRWLSADTIVPDPANPQSLNRYSFVLGNVVNYIDPTGHEEEGVCGFDGEACIDVSALWDPYTLQWVENPHVAEQAFLLFLSDPGKLGPTSGFRTQAGQSKRNKQRLDPGTQVCSRIVRDDARGMDGESCDI